MRPLFEAKDTHNGEIYFVNIWNLGGDTGRFAVFYSSLCLKSEITSDGVPASSPCCYKSEWYCFLWIHFTFLSMIDRCSLNQEKIKKRSTWQPSFTPMHWFFIPKHAVDLLMIKQKGDHRFPLEQIVVRHLFMPEAKTLHMLLQTFMSCWWTDTVFAFLCSYHRSRLLILWRRRCHVCWRSKLSMLNGSSRRLISEVVVVFRAFAR